MKLSKTFCWSSLVIITININTEMLLEQIDTEWTYP